MIFGKRIFYIHLLIFFLLLNNSCKDKNDDPVVSTNDITTITVKVSEINELKGKLHIALYNNMEDWESDIGANSSGHEFKIIRENSVEDGQKIKFEDVPAGAYAVTLYQDLDDNGELNRTFGILPAEPYGFSNNIVPTLSPPKFDKCSFTIEEEQSIELSIDLIGS